MSDSPAVRQAIAALHWPGHLEIGEPDIAARVAEYGTDSGWPCDEWDWTRHLVVRRIDGTFADHGPASWNRENPHAPAVPQWLTRDE